MRNDDDGSTNAGEKRRTSSTPAALAGHTVLIVGATADVLRCACRVLERRGIVARTTTLDRLREDAANLKPLMLLIDASVDDFDPEALAALAHDVGTKLSIVNDAKEAEWVLDRLVGSTSTNASAPPARPRLELDTARMAPGALQAAIDSMSKSRFEIETAKYDAKTIRDAIERMNEPDKPAK